MVSLFVHIAISFENSWPRTLVKATRTPQWYKSVQHTVKVDGSLRSMYRCCQTRFWRCPRFCSSCLPNSSAVSSCGALPASAPLTESFSSPRRPRWTPCWHKPRTDVSKFTAGAVKKRENISKANRENLTPREDELHDKARSGEESHNDDVIGNSYVEHWTLASKRGVENPERWLTG